MSVAYVLSFFHWKFMFFHVWHIFCWDMHMAAQKLVGMELGLSGCILAIPVVRKFSPNLTWAYAKRLQNLDKPKATSSVHHPLLLFVERWPEWSNLVSMSAKPVALRDKPQKSNFYHFWALRQTKDKEWLRTTRCRKKTAHSHLMLDSSASAAGSCKARFSRFQREKLFEFFIVHVRKEILTWSQWLHAYWWNFEGDTPSN